MAVACLMVLLSGCTAAGLALVNNPYLLRGDYTAQEIAYGPDKAQRLDLYLPTAKPGDTARNVVVFFHGGRWQNGHKEDVRFVGADLAKRGFIVVIPEFRNYPQVRFPVFVEDGARALAWVADHIARYGGRPDRIHLVGHSSGAHIAALLAADERYLAAQNKNARQIIRDFVGLAGPYAFTPDEPDLVKIFGPPERYPQMQATTFIDGDEPPMLLMHGGKDETVAAYNHERLAQRIREKGGHARVVLYPDLGHLGIVGTFSSLGPDSSVIRDMIAFFRSND